MAGYKGAGLALMFGLLAGTLNGALFGRDCVDFNADPSKVDQYRPVRAGARSQPLPAARRPSRQKSTATSAACAIRKPLPGNEAVRLPGDARAKRRADRLRNGLTLPAELLAQLDKLAAELSIPPLAAR